MSSIIQSICITEEQEKFVSQKAIEKDISRSKYIRGLILNEMNKK